MALWYFLRQNNCGKSKSCSQKDAVSKRQGVLETVIKSRANIFCIHGKWRNCISCPEELSFKLRKNTLKSINWKQNNNRISLTFFVACVSRTTLIYCSKMEQKSFRVRLYQKSKAPLLENSLYVANANLLFSLYTFYHFFDSMFACSSFNFCSIKQWKFCI